jgi:hypothetical protein
VEIKQDILRDLSYDREGHGKITLRERIRGGWN